MIIPCKVSFLFLFFLLFVFVEISLVMWVALCLNAPFTVYPIVTTCNVVYFHCTYQTLALKLHLDTKVPYSEGT